QRAGEYVGGENAVRADARAAAQLRGAHEMFLAEVVRDRDPLTCAASAPIREAARLMTKAGASAIALTEEGRVTGVLTSPDLVRWISRRESDANQPAHTIASQPVTVAPDTLVSSGVLSIGESRAQCLAIT